MASERQAKVTSVEALGQFRSSLILYMASMNNALDEVRDEVRRTRVWLQQDKRAEWEGSYKRLTKQLEQAESELFTSRLSAMTSHSAARQMAVTRLRRQVRDVEEKLRVLKKWNGNYESLVSPLVKKLDSLQHTLSSDLPKAVAFLTKAQESLDAYKRIASDGQVGGSGGGKPAETESGTEPAKEGEE